ncbi:hypothetical protein MTO96_037875 [Rhipicephalus appendiculatus]
MANLSVNIDQLLSCLLETLLQPTLSPYHFLGMGIQAKVTASIEPRPFYVFGHMANSLEEVDDFVGQGVNAIEADLTFASDGTAEKFYHGKFCDCDRDCEKSTESSTYLSYLRDAVSEGK